MKNNIKAKEKAALVRYIQSIGYNVVWGIKDKKLAAIINQIDRNYPIERKSVALFYVVNESKIKPFLSLVKSKDDKVLKTEKTYLKRKNKERVLKTKPKRDDEATSIKKAWQVYCFMRDKFYQSPEWRKLRYEVLREQGGRCQLCGRSAKDGVVLHIDHITPLSKDWSKRLDKNNLQVLCEDCNLGKSNTDSIDWRK